MSAGEFYSTLAECLGELMTEAKFWEEIRTNCPDPEWTRLENTAMPGAPDVNGCRDGVDAWVELKIKKGNLIEIRYSQLAWFRRRLQRRARNIWVVARGKDAVYVWSAARVLVASLTPTREDEKSMFIAPGEPDYKAVMPVYWKGVENFIFETSRGIVLDDRRESEN